MLWIFIFIFAVALAVAAYLYIQSIKGSNKPEQAADEAPTLAPTEKREDAIVSIQTQASLLGITEKTNINGLVDKCIDVHEALGSVNPEERAQLHSVPGDFTRLIEIHLPDLLTKFGQISASATDEDIKKFNGLMEQLHGELDTILKNIADRNYVAFASKHGFMEIRYSDKF
jgi:hypothetical protein